MKNYLYDNKFYCKFEYFNQRFSNKLTVIYVHGLCSDPWGPKPEAVKNFCKQNNLAFFRFELAGHGSDKANYLNADFNDWKKQLLKIIDTKISGAILLVGSSLGGWLSLIAARDRAERIVGVVGLAPAPDFTYDMENFVLTAAQKAELSKGVLYYPVKNFTYVVTQKMFDTARENLLLLTPLAIKCPIHILHGTEDKNLNSQKPFKLQAVLESDNVIVKLIKGATHSLDRENDIAELCSSLLSLTSIYFNNKRNIQTK